MQKIVNFCQAFANLHFTQDLNKVMNARKCQFRHISVFHYNMWSHKDHCSLEVIIHSCPNWLTLLSLLRFDSGGIKLKTCNQLYILHIKIHSFGNFAFFNRTFAINTGIYILVKVVFNKKAYRPQINKLCNSKTQRPIFFLNGHLSLLYFFKFLVKRNSWKRGIN